MFHRGKPPDHVVSNSNGKKDLTLGDLRAAYFQSQEKKLEQTTLDGIRLHFGQFFEKRGMQAAAVATPTCVSARRCDACPSGVSAYRGVWARRG